jgi:hypothetical protein
MPKNVEPVRASTPVWMVATTSYRAFVEDNNSLQARGRWPSGTACGGSP